MADMKADDMEQQNEQRELLASIGDLVERVLGDRHDVLCGTGCDRETWEKLGGELGLLAAALPEALGGMEAGPAAHAILMEGFGRHLVAQPYLSTMVMASALLDPAGAAGAKWLSAAAQGEMIIVPALADGPNDYDLQSANTVVDMGAEELVLSGNKILVRDAPLADHFVVLARQENGDSESPFLLMVAANTQGVTREDFKMIDGASGSHLHFDGVRLPRSCVIASGEEARGRAEQAMDDGTVAVCAEAVGIMQTMLDQTVEYTRERMQFGQPLSAFQVLQHRMVDMSVVIEQAQSITQLARGKLHSRDRATATSACMALVAKACRRVAQDAVQIHGAIGIADETPISGYFRRALAIEKQFGGKQFHLQRYMKGSHLS